MKWPLLALAAATPAFGQMAPQPQPTLTLGAAGALDLDWDGLDGRSYFIQSSEDLMTWKYFPVVELGLGEPLGYGFASDTDKFFVRLKYTDEPTDDPENADFDRDGLNNLAEISLSHTDPFKADSDGDGLLDGWEVANGIDPNDDGSINPINGGSGDWDGDGDSNSNEAINNTDPKSTVDHSLKVMAITRGLSANYGRADSNQFAITTRTQDYWTEGSGWLFNESVGSIPGIQTQSDYLESTHPFPSYQELLSHHEGNAYATGMIWWDEQDNLQRSILIQHTRFWAKVGKPSPVSRSIPFVLTKKQSLGYPPVSTVEEEVMNLVVPANSTVSEPKDLMPPFLAANGSQDVQISARPITFSLRHKEKIRDLDGVETLQIVAPGADTVLRDEIVDLVLSVPSGGEGRALTIDIDGDPESAALKKETLGARGETQMYDFGTVGVNDVVTSLTTNGSTGETVEGPYAVTIPANSGDTITLKAVFNKEGKFKLRLKSTDNPTTIDVLSQEFTVTKRIRKYATREFPGQTESNDFDAIFEKSTDLWPDWKVEGPDGNYTFRDNQSRYTPELLKAISWKECDLHPANAAAHGTTKFDIMQVNAGNRPGSSDMSGASAIADWNDRAPAVDVQVIIDETNQIKSLYLFEVDHPDSFDNADFSVRKMRYARASMQPMKSYSASVNWAIRKLLYKQYFSLLDDFFPPVGDDPPVNNTNIEKIKVRGAGPTLFALSPPTRHSLEETITRYGDLTPVYAPHVIRMRDEGIGTREINEYRWPVITTMKARH